MDRINRSIDRAALFSDSVAVKQYEDTKNIQTLFSQVEVLQKQIDATTTRQADFNVEFLKKIQDHANNFHTHDLVLQDKLSQISQDITLLKGIIENIRVNIRVSKGLPPTTTSNKRPRVLQRKRARR